MKQIRNGIALLNVVITVIALAIAIVQLFFADLFFDYVLNLMVAFALIGSVLHMRGTIKKTNFILPNDDLVWVHLVLFTVYFITRVLVSTFSYYYGVEQDKLAEIGD